MTGLNFRVQAYTLGVLPEDNEDCGLTDRTLDVSARRGSAVATGCWAPISKRPRPQLRYVLYLVLCFVFALSGDGNSQTPSTGALVGVALDPAGFVIPGVALCAINLETARSNCTTSDKDGRFSFLLLQPGQYEVKASKGGFAPVRTIEINISVTETSNLQFHLALAAIHEQVQVNSERPMFQTDSAALGRVVNENALANLPLVTRNLAQISGLSPGVATGVFNAGELGLGGMALSQIASSNDGIFAHGARSSENNWELDGISVSDVQSSGAGSGGIPVPNPDTLQEFKVQTALYDAAYGRYAGANVSVITKAGTNVSHGTIFEFLRNDVLNANDFFLSRLAQPRPNLKQSIRIFPRRPCQERQTAFLRVLSRDTAGEWCSRRSGARGVHFDLVISANNRRQVASSAR